MVVPRKPAYRPDEKVSKSRAFNALILTVISIGLFVALLYHARWAVNVMSNRPYGSFMNNLVFGPGTLIANAGISYKVASFINEKLVEDKIDADHKKYL